MRAFDIGRLFSQQSPHLLRIAINHLCMNGNEPTARALFDDLQIVPIWTWLLVGRRSASPPIFGDLSPRLYHRLPVATFPIGCHSWRGRGVAARLELGHQLEGHFFLRFGNGPSNAQPTL